MKPKPFASLNHFTVPCPMTFLFCCCPALRPVGPRSHPRSDARCMPRSLFSAGLGASYWMSQVSFDHAQLRVFLGRREARGAAARLRARGPADPMDVVLGRVRQIEVYDVRDLRHVDPARGDIGGG